jgi:hypothetical protein
MSDSTDPSENANLDDPQLFRPLCAPLQRVLQAPSDYPGNFYEYTYDGRFGVTLRYGGPENGLNPRHQLTIQACGQPQPTVVSNCPAACLYPQYGAGLLSWSDGLPGSSASRLHLRVASTGREYRWIWSDANGFSPAIAHTRRWLFLQDCKKQRCRVVASLVPK